MQEENNNDVMSESSSDQSNQEQQLSDSSVSQEQTASEQVVEPKEESKPFHLHPRFQELVSERNQERQARQEMQKQMQEMAQTLKTLQSANQPKAPAIKDRLKGIDPEFADYVSRVEKVDTIEQELQDLRAFKQEFMAREAQQQARSAIDKFYADNKVSADRKDFYDAMLAQTASQNKNLTTNDLPNVLKDIHDKISKAFQSVERETTQKYVGDKKAAATAPQTQPKGQAPKNGKLDYSKDPNEAKRQLTAEILKHTRAGKEI